MPTEIAGRGGEHATREYHARLSFPRPATLRALDKPIYSLGHLSRRAWDARMDSAGHSRASSHNHGDGFDGVICYLDDRVLLHVPRTPFRAGGAVSKGETATIQEVIGLTEDKKHGAYVGLLAGHDVPVYLDINAMVQKHVSIVAKTGGGKSYIAGVLIEELIKHHVTCVILDPHGEYASLREKGKHAEGSVRFHVEPRGYADIIQVFSPDTKINPGCRPLKFTLSNLDARDILSLTGSARVRIHLTALRKALDLLRQAAKDYTIRDIIRVLEREDDPQNTSLLDELEYLSEVEIFAKEGTRIDELV